MMDCPHIIWIAGALGLTLGSAAQAAWPEDLPEAEKPLANTVDPWGLAFSDQLARFQSYFAARPDAPFALGLTHDLVKIWPTKYWFRGETFLAGVARARADRELWAAAGETVSFQAVALPRLGAAEATYRLRVEAPAGLAVTVFREHFVQTCPDAAYPRFNTDRWPDPLVPAEEVTVGGTEAGVFWVDVTVPADFAVRQSSLRVSLTDGAEEAACELTLRVVPGLDLRPKDYPLVAWFWQNRGPWELSEEQFLGMCEMLLQHHFVPLNALANVFDPHDPTRFEARHKALADWGQRLFDLGSPGQAGFDQLYARIKDQGWIEQCLLYSNEDEPDPDTFRTKNIPFCQEIHRKYPGLRVYLASDGQADMEQGCDLWMTDLSASRYDPAADGRRAAPELWHYYCHLPVRWQMRAPLSRAPNMQIDNDALEHRLALWVSAHLGAKGVFIWAGNAWDMAADFWEKPVLKTEPSGFPYAGIHNGNGYLVYPPREPGGPVQPSLRLKVLRDGLEDLALLRATAARLDQFDEASQQQLKALLDPTPGVFVHAHYFDHQPEALLGRREAILKVLAEGQ